MTDLITLITGVQAIASTLGTDGQGQCDRGNGKMVKWSFHGHIRKFHWKYKGVCVDQATGETGTAVKNSRAGSIEHSMKDLFQKLAARNAL